jgi:AcrR family transcriptional regulator
VLTNEQFSQLGLNLVARTKIAKRKAKPAARVRRVVRRRRKPEEARREALIAARGLLLREGPDALTLQHVAAEIGMSHTNLLHHFGSAWELQSALMAMMVTELTTALDEAVTHFRSDEGAPRALIDMVFDAFDKGGAGRLAAWIALSGHLDHLEPIEEAVNNLVAAVEEKFAFEPGNPHMGVTSAVLFLGLMAFGDAVIGAPLKDMLERERTAPRKIASILLPKFFEVR